MNQHEKINYVEFPANNLPATQLFFEQAFSWSFERFGTDYIAFSDEGLNGGFFTSEFHSDANKGAALIVFYSHDLESTQNKIIQANGIIIEPTFPFPGGRRFHFSEPSGNEFAVWSDKDA